MKTLAFFLVALFAFEANAQNQEYVCQPCGGACDATVYHAPGTCAVCNMPLVDKSTVKFTNLTPAEFCARISANPDVVLLDVRSPGEFDGSTSRMASFGHFKNAININIDDLERRVTELAKYKDKEVLVYCSHSRRSPRASHFLGTQGFTNVKNMSGGVSTIGTQAKDACFVSHYVAHNR